LGAWGSPVNWPVLSIHASVLPDGKVLTWGRSDRQETLWDPTTGSFQSIPRPADLFCSGHALLPDGRLIVMGGHSGTDNIGIAVTNLFDYVSRTWSPGPTMQNGRWYPSVLALPNGEALVVSGGGTDGTLNTIPEVLSPSGTTLRSLTAAASSINYYPMMFVAPNGSVFIAGPDRTTGYLTTGGTGGKSTGPSSAYGYRDYGSAVMYEPGKILLVGGGGPTNSAERIDLNAGGTWQSAGAMRVARRQMNATLLADGTVLITGGTNASGFNNPPTDANVLAAERWSPSGGWTQLARQTHYRLYHSNALLLPDGRVLSVGSGQPSASGLQDDYSGEVFSPPYLFNLDGTAATRPTITAAPGGVTYGQSFAIGTPNAAAIAKVTFIRLSSVTHATNMNQRLNYLPITTRNASSVTVTGPLGATLAPPGHYMMFLVDENGVPSVAKIVQIQ
jgi:WD40 repeat protein